MAGVFFPVDFPSRLIHAPDGTDSTSTPPVREGRLLSSAGAEGVVGDRGTDVISGAGVVPASVASG